MYYCSFSNTYHLSTSIFILPTYTSICATYHWCFTCLCHAYAKNSRLRFGLHSLRTYYPFLYM